MGAGKGTPVLDDTTTEEEFAAVVDRAGRELDRDLLVALLPERNSVYQGRSANTVNRMRGYLLAAFERAGLPEPALPYVVEELESGRDAYLVAAAARALRGRERRSRDAVPFLLKAVENIKYADDAVSFDRYRPSWPPLAQTTAMEEIAATFAWLDDEAWSARAALQGLLAEPGVLSHSARSTLESLVAGFSTARSCCAVPVPSPGRADHLPSAAPSDHEVHPGTEMPAGVELEDQDGARVTYAEFFTGKPSVVAFFYTRCDNPNKCSLTITKLGRLQRRLAELKLDGQVRTAAITYDPRFDTPARLRAYGDIRGVVFGPSDRIFRTRGALAPLEQWFGLGVSFGGTLVNRHRIELFLLDRAGRMAGAFTRRQWEVEEVLAQAANLAGHRDTVTD